MFTHDNIMIGMIKRPCTIEIEKETIQRILLECGVKAGIVKIGEPHAWIMQSQRIYLDDGRCLLLKVAINSDWTDSSSILNQVSAAEIIRSTGIKQPKVLSYNINVDEYGFMFILFENQDAERFCDVYGKSSKSERELVYGAIGHAYSCIHSISNDWSGVWDGTPAKKKYPIHPAAFYSKAGFHEGSAKYLVNNGIISDVMFRELCTTWDENIPYLKERPSSLVHVSPFPWSIYINQNESNLSVGGVGALGDFMWWDSMSDIAHLLYPPFLDITKEERNAFIKEYNKPLDEHAINLYILLNRVCAMSGCYLSPVQKDHSEIWIKQQVETSHLTIGKIKRTKDS